MTFKKTAFLFCLPVLVSFILHLRIFNQDVMGVHSWRQAQTQTVIYNFNYSDNSIFHPQRLDLTEGSTALLYEFPLYQWIIAQVNLATYYSILNTRVVTFIFFVLGLMGFFMLLRKFVSKEIALITNALFCFSPLMYYYCVNPLPDTLALALSIWALYYFFEFVSENKLLHFLLFGLFLSLATLVKLPYILFASCFLYYIFERLKNKDYKKISGLVIVLLFCLAPAFLWYYYAIPTWSYNPVVKGIFINKSSIGQLLYYFQGNLISFVPELLTNYASCLFLVVGIYLFFKQRKSWGSVHNYFFTILIFFGAYFLYELNMIKDTHDYYLMPFIPLIFLLVARGLIYFLDRKKKMIVVILLTAAPIMAFVRINHLWDSDSPGFTSDYLNKSEQLQKIIPKNDTCIIDHDDSRFIALYFLKRKGYSLAKDEIKPGILKHYYLKGGKYLVTDNLSLQINDYPEFTFQELFSNNLKVFKIALK
ncbi:MAG: ArnT family glycosyltransferase [Bacteroidia bacterium]